MSVISLYYGQCGNQISNSFFSNIAEDITNNERDTDYYTQALTKWFNVTNSNKWEPRSVLIDTESKTIQSNKNSYYQFENIVAKSCGGSANNWAFGYCEQSELLVDQILEFTRHELEKCDGCSSFLNVFSSSGGTGSGVGSFMTERLRNEFPKKTIINAVILPYSNGELVIQSYNTLLTLSKIYSLSDSIILFENDRLHYNCVNSLDIKNVNFTNMNDLISRQLLSVYQPLINTQTDQLFSKLCENPLYKFLEIRLAPLSRLDNPQNFQSLLLSISRQSRYDLQQKAINKIHLKPKNLSLALVCRGLYKPSEKDLKPFLDTNLFLENPRPKEFIQLYYQRRNFFNLDNCLTIVSNSNSVYVPLSLISRDALNLYKYRAYLHHYQKFNVDERYFKECFDVISSILTDYDSL